jgi:hypothetical protein
VSSFYDQSALAEEFADELGEEVPPMAAMWFDAIEGQRTFSALLNALRERPEMLEFVPDKSRVHWPAALLDELAYCLEGVMKAMESQHRFHLLIVS